MVARQRALRSVDSEWEGRVSEPRAAPTTPAGDDGFICRLLTHHRAAFPMWKEVGSSKELSRPTQGSLALQPTHLTAWLYQAFPEASAGRLPASTAPATTEVYRQLPGRDSHPLAIETQEVIGLIGQHLGRAIPLVFVASVVLLVTRMRGSMVIALMWTLAGCGATVWGITTLFVPPLSIRSGILLLVAFAYGLVVWVVFRRLQLESRDAKWPNEVPPTSASVCFQRLSGLSRCRSSKHEPAISTGPAGPAGPAGQ